MNSTYFQYFPNNVKSSKPLGNVLLSRFIKSIKTPIPAMANVFEQIKTADECGDMKLKQQLKSKLYYFCPCVNLIGGRKYANIHSFTGLIVLDFDKLETDYAIDFKKALFEEHQFIVAAWLSASKHGVRALVKIPIAQSVEEFKQYFMAIEFELGIYKGFDPAPKNCVLPLFMSYDKDIMYREDATTWTKKYIPIEQPTIKQWFVKESNSEVENIVRKSISKITNSGHYILRATAYALGGYVAAGLISESSAIDLINDCIFSHPYLTQKKDIYKQTALTMITKGREKPLYLTK